MNTENRVGFEDLDVKVPALPLKSYAWEQTVGIALAFNVIY